MNNHFSVYGDVGFAVCVVLFFQGELCSTFSKTEYFLTVRQAFTSSTKMASSGLRKMLFFTNFNT